MGMPEVATEHVQGQGARLGGYAHWRDEGYSVGNRLVKRAVALVITLRMKKRGMRRSRQNADAVVALRTCWLNEERDEQFKARLVA